MNVTEAEAKTKWCPFSRVVIDAPSYPVSSGNRFDGASGAALEARQSSLCIASACMAWRSLPEYRADTNGETEKGYCGMAGTP